MNSLERREDVRRQLERRREVLAEWAEIGVSSLPEGTSVPVSLNQVRGWEDARLGISRVGSPSSCTTTHRVHGAVVRDIDRLLRELADQRAAQVKGKKTQGAKRKRRLAVLESSLSGRGQSICNSQHGASGDEVAATRRGAECCRVQA